MATSTPLQSVPDAELLIDEALLRELLREQAPQLCKLPLQKVGEGWDNVMYRLGDAYLMRLPKRAAAAPLMQHEQQWLPLLAPLLPIPVPAPAYTGNPSPRYPWHWSVLPWLAGDTAYASPIAAHQAARLASFLTALHQPAPADAPYNHVRGVALGDIANLLTPRLQRLAQRGYTLSPTAHKLWQAALAAPIDMPPTWLHGDLHALNVLCDAQGVITGIIDWGDMCAGDRANDLAAVWILLGDADARREAIHAMPHVTDATWARARGWAVRLGVTFMDVGNVNEPRIAEVGLRTLQRLENDFS
jgi:aminoglycoside phosphotransferase (APT) family kinase protein